MKVYLASDHAGFELKAALVARLAALGYAVEDLGAPALDLADDYPDYVTPCAKRVAGEPGSFGFVIGGSGQGEAMAANRIAGARAAVFYGEPTRPQMDAAGNVLDMIASVRAHNDANILSLGARFLTADEAVRAVERFLAASFSGEERHKRRLAKF
ncbi:MAG TPA: RpiB/LacA/LacB family sugar-phosphate isomerase [Candidatus Paceibacterota bacterium]|nr:RpiB/LacA/LacB family sugar-phosphate isomerase [Candidatus Paceibacterota bacterium]